MNLPVYAAQETMKLELTSKSFKDNDVLPTKFTCTESDVNPALEIKNIPAKTKTLAISMKSPDAPEGEWVHWVVYNIPASQTVIDENTVPGQQLFNDFGKFNYNGPCPEDSKEHHYVFTVYALSSKIEVNEGGILKDLEKAMRGHIVAQTSLTARFRKNVL